MYNITMIHVQYIIFLLIIMLKSINFKICKIIYAFIQYIKSITHSDHKPYH